MPSARSRDQAWKLCILYMNSSPPIAGQLQTGATWLRKPQTFITCTHDNPDTSRGRSWKAKIAAACVRVWCKPLDPRRCTGSGRQGNAKTLPYMHVAWPRLVCFLKVGNTVVQTQCASVP